MLLSRFSTSSLSVTWPSEQASKLYLREDPKLVVSAVVNATNGAVRRCNEAVLGPIPLVNEGDIDSVRDGVARADIEVILMQRLAGPLAGIDP